MSKDVKDTEAQEELKDKVNAGDVKEEKETKEKHAKAKKEDKDQKIEELGQKLSEINDKYLRLSAEFDNYRKRTLKERMELTKNAGDLCQLQGFLISAGSERNGMPAYRFRS